VLCWYEWDFAGAERQLRRSAELNPNLAETHFVLGSTLPAVGKLDEAVEEMRRALVIDPLGPHHSRWLGRFLLYAEDYAATIEQSHKTLELDSNYFQSYLDIGSAYLALGDAEEALDWFQRGQSLESAVRSYDALIVRALAALGEEEEARAILDRLEEEAREHYVRAEILAMGYAAIDEFDVAFQRLNEALEARSAGLIYLHLDPGYGPLRSDPRFASLVERIGIR
jgi:tetratricopeptide (TPR) repeat protein